MEDQPYVIVCDQRIKDYTGTSWIMCPLPEWKEIDTDHTVDTGVDTVCGVGSSFD